MHKDVASMATMNFPTKEHDLSLGNKNVGTSYKLKPIDTLKEKLVYLYLYGQ